MSVARLLKQPRSHPASASVSAISAAAWRSTRGSRSRRRRWRWARGAST
jgi:hypothetical protein